MILAYSGQGSEFNMFLQVSARNKEKVEVLLIPSRSLLNLQKSPRFVLAAPCSLIAQLSGKCFSQTWLKFDFARISKRGATYSIVQIRTAISKA